MAEGAMSDGEAAGSGQVGDEGHHHQRHAHDSGSHSSGSHNSGAHGSGMREGLLLHDRVFQRTLVEVVDWLGAGTGQRALDAGCGVGGMATVLAERVDALDAVDLDEENVRLTRERLAAATQRAAVEVRVGDLTHLDAPDATFDLVWSSRVVHHLPDMLAGMRELVRVTRPGGTVAIREGGFGFRVLPEETPFAGRSFEERLAAAGVGRMGRQNVPMEDAVDYPYGWPRLLADAGLVEVRARTFVFDALSPLSEDEQAWVLHQWGRWVTDERWRARLQPEDARILEALVDPGSPHHVFARDDLHLRATFCVYAGRRP